MGQSLGGLGKLFDYSRFRFVWIIYLSLGVSLVLSLLYLGNYFDVKFFVLANRGMIEHGISNSLFSPVFDTLIWATAVFLVVFFVFYRLYRCALGAASRVILQIVGVAVVGLTILAVFNVFGLVLLSFVSFFLFLLCFALSKLLFGVDGFGLFVRLIFGALFPVLFVELSALLLYNVPLALNLSPKSFQRGYSLE